MMNRRGFLKALGVFSAGLLVEPAAELLVPERKKIWAVGADLSPAARLREQRLQSPWILELPEPFRVDRAKVEVLCEYLRTSEGHKALAVAMAQPMRAHRDYEAIGRKTFIVETLPARFSPFFEAES